MVNFLLGFLTCYIICGTLQLGTDTSCRCDRALELMFVPLYAIYLVVVVIFATLFNAFKNVVKPTTFENLAKVKKRYPSHWHDYGYWGWCYDPYADQIEHKFFFYRIKKGLTS